MLPKQEFTEPQGLVCKFAWMSYLSSINEPEQWDILSKIVWLNSSFRPVTQLKIEENLA
jgi:hypothetical protein